MVKVIKEGIKGRVECNECKALLEYTKQDTRDIQTGMNEYDRRIDCPCCGKTVSVQHKPIK